MPNQTMFDPYSLAHAGAGVAARSLKLSLSQTIIAHTVFEIAENQFLKFHPTIRKIFPDLVISIDTFRSKIASASLNEGADIINDISGGTLDKNMMSVVAKNNCPYILMHMQGNPQNMQNDPSYENVTLEIIQYLAQRIKIAHDNNIVDLIVDPGFGFGKTLEHNFEILNNLEKFNVLDTPILAGFSRKSMIYKTLKTSSKKALNGTSSLNTIALMKGAKILRVHDVKEAKECIILHEKTISSLF